MDFESAVSYLDGLKAHEKMRSFVYDKENFDLEKLRKFLQLYGVDYSKMKFVHVAGSKGKGTVCNFTANYLLKQGRSVGMFTSPYIFDVRECFWFDGKVIDGTRFAELVSDLRKFSEAHEEFELTFFEVLVVVALKYFSQINAEYVVMEVGIGGELDATNVIEANVVAITAIEDEHKEILGGNMKALVTTKLGIVKRVSRAVIGRQNPEVESLIRQNLNGRGDVWYVEEEKVEKWQRDGFDRANSENLALTVVVLHLLLGQVDEQVLLNIGRNLQIPGRFQVVEMNGKTIVFDIAHTESSINNLLERLRNQFSGSKFVFLLSIMGDKKFVEIVKKIDLERGKVVFTLANALRGEDPYKLASFAENSQVEVVVDPLEAFERAISLVNKNEILVVTGSHFLVSKILKSL